MGGRASEMATPDAMIVLRDTISDVRLVVCVPGHRQMQMFVIPTIGSLVC